jgi:hypothetical protein
VFFSCQTALSQKNIQKNKLGQSISKKQLKIFKFQEKIPAFSARWSVLITVFQVFDSISFFKLSNSILSQKNIQKNKTGEKLRRLYMQYSQNWSEISCSFVQHHRISCSVGLLEILEK